LKESIGELKLKDRGKERRNQSYRTFTEDELNEKEQVVFKVLKEKGTLTDREINKELGWTINRVCGRRNSLAQKGMIVEAGEKFDTETKRTVTLWKVKT
jgi:transcription initiation factor IIE alpha subunit